MTTSSRPYLLRAIYEWLVDNKLTPYILVNATLPRVSVPERFIEDGKIILNIDPVATSHLIINNESVEFKARFSGVVHHIYVPVRAVNAIYAFEDSTQGLVFSDEDEGDSGNDTPPPESSPTANGAKGKSHLKVVK